MLVVAALAGTAIVAGVFSLVVFAMMAADFALRTAKDPLETPQFKELKDRLKTLEVGQ